MELVKIPGAAAATWKVCVVTWPLLLTLSTAELLTVVS